MLSFAKMEFALDFLPPPEFEVAADRLAKEVEKSCAAAARVNACSSSKLFTLEESYSLLAPFQADGKSCSSSMLTEFS